MSNYSSSIIDNNHDEILPTIKWESASDITPKENYEKIGFIILTESYSRSILERGHPKFEVKIYA